MTIQVTPVNSKKELNQFIKFPWTLYPADSLWVPPLLIDRKSFLNPEKNPFYKHADTRLFIARRGDSVAGIIAAAVNRLHLSIHNDATGFAGFFECVDDYNAASALFNAAADWLREQGMKRMRGPMSYTTHDPCGLLVSGFDLSPTLMTPYNPEYYVTFFDRYGFKKVSDLFAYTINSIPEGLAEVSEDILRTNPGVNIVKADRARFMRVMKGFKDVYNESMKNNWGYIPFSDEEFAYSTRNLKPVLDPDLTYIVEYNGEAAGYVLVLPDYNFILKKLNGRLFPLAPFVFAVSRKKIPTVRAVALAVKEEFREKRVAALLYISALKGAFGKGYKTMEASWIHENNNAMNSSIERMGFKKTKIYRIYDYSLV